VLRTRRDDTQKARLRQLARQAVGRVSERAHFVLLSMQGYSPPKIGVLMGYDAATVRYWLKAYHDRGLAGLYDAPRSGRPPREKHLTAIVQAQAGQPPPNYGYLQACWTVALLVCHLRERFRIQVSAATLRQALKRAGFRWTRPKLVLPRRRDPQAEEKLAKLAQALADPRATVLAEDECDMHLLAVVRAMWQRVGRQLRILTPGKNYKRGVFGALNLRTGEWFYQLTDRKRSVEFIALLASLLTAYPVGPIYVIVDNAGIHTSKAVKKWLSLHPRLELVYLPTYTGHRFNPVEKVWHALKGHIAANRSFRALAELDHAIRRYFAAFTREDALRLANSEVTRAAQAAVSISAKNLPKAA
jgi:transposase